MERSFGYELICNHLNWQGCSTIHQFDVCRQCFSNHNVGDLVNFIFLQLYFYSVFLYCNKMESQLYNPIYVLIKYTRHTFKYMKIYPIVGYFFTFSMHCMVQNINTQILQKQQQQDVSSSSSSRIPCAFYDDIRCGQITLCLGYNYCIYRLRKTRKKICIVIDGESLYIIGDCNCIIVL